MSVLRSTVAGLVSLCALTGALAVLPPVALAETCPNEEFRVGASAKLPECRAYELVTPPFKEAAITALSGGYVGSEGFAGMSVDGSHVDVTSIGNLGDSQGGLEGNSYELTRIESGWTEQTIELPATQFRASEPIDTTPELGAVLSEARANEQSIYAKDFWLREADGVLRDLGPFEPPADTAGPPGPGFGEVSIPERGEFLGASEDLSHVVFVSPASWPGDGGGTLYEYTVGQSGPPALISVEPDGEPCGANFNGYLEKSGVSADGSTVFFQCSGEMFARVDESRTVAISEPSAADCSACDTSPGVRTEASFSGASADGSKVFFVTERPLLGDDRSENVYEYDFDAAAAGPGDPDGRMVRVSGGDWGPGGAQVQGDEIKVSGDGSHVYFIALGALRGASNNRGELPREGESNLYVFDTETGTTSFIATLPSSDASEFQSGFNVVTETKPTVTPDGQFLVFLSSADLTPGDTSTAEQVFEYDAQTSDLVRVSIGQNGFNDNGNTDTFNAGIPPEGLHMPLAVSDDGAYVVFQSIDGLTPGALNGEANNVYEYHDGNVYLISDGQDNTSVVRVRGLSPSGQDIFFETADRLVPQDLDTQEDLYDARIDGGFPAPVSLLPSCTGDACQGPLSPAPVLLSPGSEFQAGGNPPLAEPTLAAKPIPKAKPKGCRRGFVKKQTKCVKRPKAKAKRSARGRK